MQKIALTALSLLSMLLPQPVIGETEPDGLNQPLIYPPTTKTATASQQPPVWPAQCDVHNAGNLYPPTSINENLPCGVRNTGGDGSAYTFMFYPWNLQIEDFVDLISAIYNTNSIDNNNPSIILPDKFALYPN